MEALDIYSQIIVKHGVGLWPGQGLFIRGRCTHKDLALRIGEAGYNEGAGEVRYHLTDQEEIAQLIRCGSPKHISSHLERDRAFYEDVLLREGAFVLLLDDCPLDPTIEKAYRMRPDNRRQFIHGRNRTCTEFQNRAIGRIPGTTAPHPTASWAKKVFPDLEEQEAVQELWNHIFRFTLADQDEVDERLKEKERMLRERTAYLNGLDIRELLVQGSGNNLTVAVTERARWISALSKTKSGQTCYINYPSEEVFTTPDTRVTEGTIVASMPLPVNGALVTDLVLEFKGGKLVDFFAREGREVLAEWLNVDGGRFLGEFALVGTDSPVSQSGLFFHHPHIDENGASHIALGMGILSCLSGGEEMSENALRDLGLNISSIHTDIMFGSSEVGIVATKTRRGAVVLMDRGVWV